MTNIIFYRIKGDYNSLLLFVCQLVNKAYQKKISVLINTPEESISKRIDDRLWSFDTVSFIPHDIESEPSSTIAINHELNPGKHDQLLINLSDSIHTWVVFKISGELSKLFMMNKKLLIIKENNIVFIRVAVTLLHTMI
jgi:DNA polymerase IIIc chi subunit